MKSVVFIIALIAISSAVRMNLDGMSALQKAASFGSIFAQIQAQIKAGGPLDNVYGLLDDLEDQVRTEQREHEDMLERNQDSCADEHDFRSGEINEGKKALNAATQHKATCEYSLGRAEVDLEVTQQNIVDDQAALDAATQLRSQQNALYLQRAKDHVHAGRAVDGAIDILDELVAEDTTLVQLSQHAQKLLKTGFRIKLVSAYAPVVAMLAQLATQDNNVFIENGSVDRIRAMLQELRQNIDDSALEFSETEQSQQGAFAILSQQLNDSIAALRLNEQNLQDHISEMQQCVLEEKLVIDAASNKVNRNQRLLDASIEMCQAFQDEYDSATDARNEELELVATVREMVKNRLGALDSTSVSRRDDEFQQHQDTAYGDDSYTHQGGNADDRRAQYESY